MRKWINLVEGTEPQEMRLFFEDGMVVMEMQGKRVGWFTIDVTHKAEGKVSIHSSIDAEYQKRGYGKAAYDWVENWLKGRGLRLIPSDRLSDSAYRLWQQRDPSAVADYEMRDYFTNGKHHFAGLEKLWYSPYGLKKWNLNEGVEVHNSTTYYRNPTVRQFGELLKKHDLRGIVNGKDVYVWNANKNVHFTACNALSLPIPNDEDDDSEGFTPSYPFYAHSKESQGDWEWNRQDNIGTGVSVMIRPDEDRAAMLACPRFAALCRASLKETAIPGWYGGVRTGEDGKPYKIETNGGWILPNGTYEEIDHHRDWHHVSIALASFADEVRNEDGGIDEHSEDAAWGMALDDGWIRLHIDKQTFNTQFAPSEVSREAIRTLLELIDEDVYHLRYGLELGIGEYASFGDKKQFIRAIRESLKK